MDDFRFTKPQQEALHTALSAAGWKGADDWPKYLDATERVVQRAVQMAKSDAVERPPYASQAHRKLVKLHRALKTTRILYEDLGCFLEGYLDSHVLLDSELARSIPEPARAIAEQILSGGRFPLALETVAEATQRCTVALMHQRNLFPQTGAPGNSAIKGAVQGLMVIFKNATGQWGKVYSTAHNDEPYAGNFYSFAVAALRPARLIPDKTLGSNILTAYNEFKASYLNGSKPTRKKKKKSNKPMPSA